MRLFERRENGRALIQRMLDERIGILESLKEEEYIEEWA